MCTCDLVVLCLCGTLGKGALRTYPWGRVPTASPGVEFGVVGGSSTHAVEGADMERMWLYQMLYPNINRNRVWQIGRAEQTMMETRGDKFIIGHEASKDAPCRSVSLAMP
jgi:hypothetical protein